MISFSSFFPGPVPLKCYGDNYNHSFYSFIERSFMGFQFPNLTTFISLMTHNRTHQVKERIKRKLSRFLFGWVEEEDDLLNVCCSSSWWTPCLRHISGISFVAPTSSTTMPSSVWSTTTTSRHLCSWRLYVQPLKEKHTNKRSHIDDVKQFSVYSLQESLPVAVRRPTLPCVWPVALSSSSRSEANAWFDRRLPNYLVFLSKTLIGSNVTHNASCMAFQKLYVCFKQRYVLFLWDFYIFVFK